MNKASGKREARHPGLQVRRIKALKGRHNRQRSIVETNAIESPARLRHVYQVKKNKSQNVAKKQPDDSSSYDEMTIIRELSFDLDGAKRGLQHQMKVPHNYKRRNASPDKDLAEIDDEGKEVIKLLGRTRMVFGADEGQSSPIQNPSCPGTVTVSGKPSIDVPPGNIE